MATPSIMDTRREQMFPVLQAAEIDRLRRFGEPRSYKAGDLVVHAGQNAEGLLLILSGEVEMAPQEAELGERIMRALILRRMGLLEQSVGGPIVVGRADNRDVLRLQDFLRRNAHPYQTLDPDKDEGARTLIERFHLSPADLPTVLCVNGDLLRNPTVGQLARCIGLSHALDPAKMYDVAIVGAGPSGLAAAVYAASEGL